jgi:hypothetical protein
MSQNGMNFRKFRDGAALEPMAVVRIDELTRLAAVKTGGRRRREEDFSPPPLGCLAQRGELNYHREWTKVLEQIKESDGTMSKMMIVINVIVLIAWIAILSVTH